MLPSLRLLLAFSAGLLAAAGPMGAQSRSSPRDTRQFRTTTTFVNITVPASAYDRAAGTAVVTLPRAVLGQLYAARPWTLSVRADRATFAGHAGTDAKSTSDLAIRVSGEPAFRPLSTRAVRVLAGNRTAGWIDVAIDLQLTVRLADESGSHGFRLLFDFD